jgi:hypothetical protein
LEKITIFFVKATLIGCQKNIEFYIPLQTEGMITIEKNYYYITHIFKNLLDLNLYCVTISYTFLKSEIESLLKFIDAKMHILVQT